MRPLLGKSLTVWFHQTAQEPEKKNLNVLKGNNPKNDNGDTSQTPDIQIQNQGNKSLKHMENTNSTPTTATSATKTNSKFTRKWGYAPKDGKASAVILLNNATNKEFAIITFKNSGKDISVDLTEIDTIKMMVSEGNYKHAIVRACFQGSIVILPKTPKAEAAA